MARILFNNWDQGKNNAIDPDILGNRVQKDGACAGPMVELSNVDRDRGNLRLRGATTTVIAALPGNVLGLCPVGPFEHDTQHVEPDHNEVLLVAYDASPDSLGLDQTYIGRVITGATCEWQFLGRMAGAGPCTFLDLGQSILCYNGTGSVVISTVCETPDPTGWTANGSGRIVIPSTPWDKISMRWWNGASTASISVKIGTTWYGPYRITDGLSDSTANQLVVSDGSPHAIPAGSLASVVILNGNPQPGPAPLRAPTVIRSTATGTTLTAGMAYQYAITYAHGLYETSPSPWTAAVYANSGGADGSGTLHDLLIIPSGDFPRYEHINIYRRGGTNADNAMLVTTLDNPLVSLAGSKRVAFLTATGVNRGAGTISVPHASLAGWPTTGGVWLGPTGNEWASYTGVTLGSGTDPDTFTGCAFYGSPGTYAVGDQVVFCGWTDATPDSEVVGTVLAIDHGWLSNAVGTAEKSSDRLHICFSEDYPSSQVFLSSIFGWQYFNDLDAKGVSDIDDDYTGGKRDIGADSYPVVALAVAPTGDLMVFKRDAVYLLSGRSVWAMQIQRMAGMPGCDAPRSIVSRGGVVSWLKGGRYWAWDGERLIDLGEVIPDDLGAIFPGAIANAFAYTYGPKLVLCFATDSTSGNVSYVEWDARRTALYSSGSGPSPVAGTRSASVACAVESTLRLASGIVYAGIGKGVYALDGTGDAYYMDTADPIYPASATIQTPNVAVGSVDGTADVAIESFAIDLHDLSYDLTVDDNGALVAPPSITVTRIIDGTAQAPVTYAVADVIDGCLFRGLQSDKRGARIGLRVTLTGFYTFALNAITMIVGDSRPRNRR